MQIKGKGIFGHYKPLWMFWHPGSGLLGGVIFGAVVFGGGYLLFFAR